MRRDYLFWGIVLILLGGLMFMNSAGFILPGGINAMRLFWPMVLILLGIWIISGVFTSHNTAMEPASVVLGEATQASLRLSHGAGRLRLGGGASPGQFLDGKFAGGIKQNIKRFGELLDVHLEARPSYFPSFLDSFYGMKWDIDLNLDTPFSLKLETGASKAELDLRDLLVTELIVNTGASKTNITLPSNAGETIVKIELGAASLDLLVPDGVEARVRAEQGVSAIEVDTNRFPYSNGIYESAKFSSAPNKADILIKAGAGRVSVR
jgi:hypothetical protein